jgi:LacI family transcriptional regulator
MLGGIQEVASKAGYRVIICNSNENHETEIANIQGLMNHLIDGLLICHSIQTSSYEHIRIHLGKRIPIVQFYRVAIGLPISQILAEDEVGAEKVTDYLIKKGCRRIALLLGPKNLSITQKRFNGYKISLEKHGINLDIKLLAHVDFLQESVEKALEDWLKIDPKIDGIISISDKSAAQIIRLLKKKSIKIPEEINVFGFGNEFTGQIVEPELSTFDTKTRIIGEEAARLIIEQIISGNQEITSKLIPGEIVLRGSA